MSQDTARFRGKPLLTLDEAADYLNAGPHYVDRLIQEGTLTPEQVDGEVLISHKELALLRRQLQAQRRKALDELFAISEALGLYDLPDQKEE